MREYYNQNKDKLYTFREDAVRAAHVLVPLDQESKAKEIAAKARAGGEFAELARLYSIGLGSSGVGGDLGYFTKTARAEAIDRMLPQKQAQLVDQWLADLKKGANIEQAGKNE